MAVFNSTKRKYKDKFDNGFSWFNTISSEVQKILSSKEGSILSDAFNLTEFYTENQKEFWNKQRTWVWFKCHLSAIACQSILIDTDLANDVEHFALITHDKDKDTTPHTHVLIKFFRNVWINKLVEYFHADSCSNALNNAYERFHYLLHDSETCRKAGKYQYDVSELVTDDIAFFNGLQKVVLDNTPMTIINAIIEGKSERYLCETFGDRYIYNKRRYQDSALTIMSQENLKIHDFHVEYITDDVLAIYDNRSGNLIDIKRSLSEVK